MNGWGWVLLGYGIIGAALVAYTASLRIRMRSALRRLRELD